MDIFVLPIWVYSTFIILLYLGLRHCFKTTIHIIRLIIFPTLFSILAWRNLSVADQFHHYGQWIWLLGITVGLFKGIILKKKTGIRADKKRWRIELPGSKVLLLLVFALFYLEYLVNYVMIIHSPLRNAKVFIILTMLLSGWIAGIVVGRHINYLQRFFKASHTELT